MTKDKQITILGFLHIARGGLVLVIGFVGFVFLAGIGVFTGDRTALGVLSIIGTLAVIFMGFLAIPSILAGIGLLNRKEWGRILALAVGFVSLIDFPFGTALGVYTIWLLFDNEAMKCFGATDQAQAVPAQQIPVT